MSRKTTALRSAEVGVAALDGAETGRRRRNGARTLGPVSDLEDHLPSDWWRTLFNALYLETDGDVFENERNTVEEVDLLIRQHRAGT